VMLFASTLDLIKYRLSNSLSVISNTMNLFQASQNTID
jgi:hypothetical protein